MKTPITYYGGKQSMLRHILPKIPAHRVYCEPFFGGGAVFFAKDPAGVEIINDIDDRVINFYKVLKTKFDELKVLIDCTLHSRAQHKLAGEYLRNGATDVQKAWAFWVQTNQSVGGSLGSGWSHHKADCYVTAPEVVFRKKERITIGYESRLRNTQIDSQDALKVIDWSDSQDTFFFIDPPYINACQGHYSGYTEEMFNALLDKLATLKGKFLLTSYPTETLTKYRTKCGWNSQDLNLKTQAGSKGQTKDKTECMTWNYDLKQLKLF